MAPLAQDRRAHPPGAFRRWVFRLPLHLGRRTGRLVERLFARAVGVEWIALDTIGRRSGRPHTVLLDVIGRDRERDLYYVQPAYGRHADWVRNVAACPEVTARVGERVVHARVRDATGAEGAEAVLRFIRDHQRYARLVAWFVEYVGRIDRPDAELRRELMSTVVLAIEVEPKETVPLEKGLPPFR